MKFSHAWKKQLALPNVDLFVCTRCALFATIGAAGVFYLVCLGRETSMLERYRWIQMRPASGSVAALKFVRASDAELGEEPSCISGAS